MTDTLAARRELLRRRRAQSATDRAGTDRAGTDRAGTDRAGTDRAGTDRAGTDRAGTDRSTTDRSAVGAASPGGLGTAEHRMWRIHQLDADSVSHNLTLILECSGTDAVRLAAGVADTVAQAPVLGSVVRVAADDVVGRAPAPVTGRWIEPGARWILGAPEHPGVEAEPAQIAHTWARTPFDLTTDPPIRAAVIGQTLVLSVHHLAVDDTSWPLLLGSMLAGRWRPQDVAGGSRPAGDPGPARVAAALEQARRTWAREGLAYPISGTIPATTPVQSWLAPLDEAPGRQLRQPLDRADLSAFTAFAPSVGGTGNAALVVLCALAVTAVTGATDHVVLVPVDNRRVDQTPDRVGYCGNIVPIRFTFDPAGTVADAMRAGLAAVYAATEFADVDFGSVLTALRRSGGRFPVTELLVSVRNAPMRGIAVPDGMSVDYRSVSGGIAPYPLALAIEIAADGGAHLECDHQRGTDDAVAERAVTAVAELLRRIPVAADEPLQALVGALATQNPTAQKSATQNPATQHPVGQPERNGVCCPDSRFARPGTGWSEIGRQLTAAAQAVDTSGPRPPLPVGAPADVLERVAAELGPRELPRHGIGEQPALDAMARVVHRYGLNLTHELCAAHLQPPALSVAVAADALASATNASLDTYDSGPATLAIESWTVDVLARLAGLPPTAGGVFGPGGSYSNLLAMLIARDQAGAARGIDVRRDGVGGLGSPVVLCSAVAHFSIQRACAALGLGEGAVVTVDCDAENRMIPAALEAALDSLGADPATGLPRTPIAVVATAGTTDFGTVDPLPAIAAIARRRGLWFHVDAAYGFGALFSDRFAGLVTGIGGADSITLDLHKVGWQPAAASLLLLADTESFASLDRNVAYLNPDDDMEAGFGGRLGLTLQTTRRPDVLKVATTLMAYGRDGLGEMLEACHDLARHAQRRIEAEPQFELVSGATLTTVVFRYRCAAAAIDAINGEVRRRLISSGTALIGRTGTGVGTCLKLTLLNPQTRPADIDRLFDEILRVALETESEGLIPVTQSEGLIPVTQSEGLIQQAQSEGLTPTERTHP